MKTAVAAAMHVMLCVVVFLLIGGVVLYITVTAQAPPPMLIVPLDALYGTAIAVLDGPYLTARPSTRRKQSASFDASPAEYRPSRYSMRDLLYLLLATLFEHGVPVDGIALKAAAALPREQAKECLEVLFTLGWDFNEALSNTEPSVLRYALPFQARIELTADSVALHDIAPTRWLPQNGADPNAGCYIEYMTFSVAVNRSTIPTVQLLLQYAQHSHNGHLVYHATQRADIHDATKMIKLLHDHNKPIDDMLYRIRRPIGSELHFYEELRCIVHAARTKYPSLLRSLSSAPIQTSLT